ncbi:uncharacterized protein DNG_08805 [Cephalotrichum gorgonifer]|uniref:2EXR domain-containing protein n=1 Tax=Cephalotrichum gorgonifer TaxID=2041049 RepID=A0AAE8N493_9PEZI|nr:uncharacterized protein DNG_08805 [Cephalotrichum gorgonifer]
MAAPDQSVEHVRRLTLPLVSDDASAIANIVSEALYATIIKEEGFAYFPRLPGELQDIIWQFAFKSRTFRAWSHTIETGQSTHHQLILESDRLWRRHIPHYEICRRSRALAVSAYGLPGDDNPIPFHRSLDVIELLGSSNDRSILERQMYRLSPVIPRVSSWDVGAESLVLRSRAEEVSTEALMGMNYFWVDQVDSTSAPAHGAGACAKPASWCVFNSPFERAGQAVLCYYWNGMESLYIVGWAAYMLPNLAALALRSYFNELTLLLSKEREMQPVLYLKKRLEEVVSRKTWPRLKNIDFTRQDITGLYLPGGY